MSDITEFAKTLRIFNHEHLFTLSSLRDKLGIDAFSEIGGFILNYKDNCRLYLAYYFEYGKNEYKFDICVNREEPKETFFHLGLKRKDNKKLNPLDVQNCKDILDNVNKSLKTNYGFSNEGKTLYLSPLSEDNLKNFINEAFKSCGLGKMKKIKDERSKDYITLSKAVEIFKKMK